MIRSHSLQYKAVLTSLTFLVSYTILSCSRDSSDSDSQRNNTASSETRALTGQASSPDASNKIKIESDVVAELRRDIKELEDRYVATKNKNIALLLSGKLAALASMLDKQRETENVILAVQRAIEIENSEANIRGEERQATYILGRLLNKWIYNDGDSFIAYLRSAHVTSGDKNSAIIHLSDVIAKGYPGMKNGKIVPEVALLMKWIQNDGESFMKYLRDKEASISGKKEAIRYLTKIIRKDYAGK